MTENMKSKILDIMDQSRDMSIATQREDGFPQATVVSFVHDGLRVYFGCGPSSQKAHNIARHPEVSLTMTPPYDSWHTITGLSLAGTARRVTDPKEMQHIGDLMLSKFPQVADYMPETEDDICLIRIDPVVISVLDYTKGFGHTELVRI